MITVQTQDAGSLSRVEVRKDNPHLVEHKYEVLCSIFGATEGVRSNVLAGARSLVNGSRRNSDGSGVHVAS